MGSKINVPYDGTGENDMKRFRVTVRFSRDSIAYDVDTTVETKQSARAVINRFLRKYPDCYEVSVDAESVVNFLYPIKAFDNSNGENHARQ